MRKPDAREEEQLLAGFNVYDQHVDVVSVFEWVFTDPGVKDMPSTVQHFERFPRVQSAHGVELTPDFTVLFRDGTGIIGEIANIALVEESVDSLCDQIGKYAEVTALPDVSGTLSPSSHIDVMQIVEMSVGLDALRRIIQERYLNPSHPYSPPRPPCVVQFSRNDATYTFQRIPDPRNGVLYGGERVPHIQTYLDRGFKPPIRRFAHVKVSSAFTNDPVNALYLATHLWLRTWPTQEGAATDDLVVDPSQVAAELRAQYRTVRTKDVTRALLLLWRAGLAAERPSDGRWLVSRRQLGRVGNRDVHKLIVDRIMNNAPGLVTARTRAPEPDPPRTLF